MLPAEGGEEEPSDICQSILYFSISLLSRYTVLPEPTLTGGREIPLQQPLILPSAGGEIHKSSPL